ncbi:hypothetical protein PoB_005661200 [Plakobranchus ocellatus]|uniref:Uncharacterized protein n=1 Tax=Plakobranchus ocellatus TaxID=259542 RepID=A0AAV4CFR7_9GAST|nr:hypothetical protein PoB_005661200 [Plakobranchus ocellatus]
MGIWLIFYAVSPQEGDLRLSDLPSDWSAGGGARIHDRTAPADLRADSLSTKPSTSLAKEKSGTDFDDHDPPLKPVLSEPYKAVVATIPYCP